LSAAFAAAIGKGLLRVLTGGRGGEEGEPTPSNVLFVRPVSGFEPPQCAGSQKKIEARVASVVAEHALKR
jgi:hypothetical protein